MARFINRTSGKNVERSKIRSPGPNSAIWLPSRLRREACLTSAQMLDLAISCNSLSITPLLLQRKMGIK